MAFEDMMNLPALLSLMTAGGGGQQVKVPQVRSRSPYGGPAGQLPEGNAPDPLSHMGLSDALALAFLPHALPLLNAVSQMRNAHQDRELALKDREFRRQQIEKQQTLDELNQKRQDAQTKLNILQQGGRVLPSGPVTQMAEAISNRPTVDVPGIGGVEMPNQQEQLTKLAGQERAKQQMALEGKVTEAKTLQPILHPSTPIELPGLGKVSIQNEHLPTVLKTLADMSNDKYAAHSFEKDDAGNVTFVGIDAKTKQPVKIGLGAIGTTKTVGEEGKITPAHRDVLSTEFEKLKAEAGQANADYQAVAALPLNPKTSLRQSTDSKGVVKDLSPAEYKTWLGDVSRKADDAKNKFEAAKKRAVGAGFTLKPDGEGIEYSIPPTTAKTKTAAASAEGVPDKTGHIPGKSIVEHQGKKYIYRGLNPATGKMKLEAVQ